MCLFLVGASPVCSTVTEYLMYNKTKKVLLRNSSLNGTYQPKQTQKLIKPLTQWELSASSGMVKQDITAKADSETNQTINSIGAFCIKWHVTRVCS